MNKLITINGIGPDNTFNFSHNGSKYTYDKRDEQGNIVYELDAEGNPKLDYDGNQITVKENLVAINHHHQNGTPSENPGVFDGLTDVVGPAGLITSDVITLPYTHIECYDYDWGSEGTLKTMGVSTLRRYIWKFAPINHNHTGEYLEDILGTTEAVSLVTNGITSSVNGSLVTLSSTANDPGGLPITGYVNENTNRWDALLVSVIEEDYSGSEYSENLTFVSEPVNI